jgi:hypothetical protein
MENAKIYQAISNIISDIGAIGKDSRNVTQNFMYRGIDDVMNALQPVLSKHHVFIVPEVIEREREERQTQKGGLLIYSICKVKYTFYAEDGSFITAVVVGEGMDSGDKATNKAMSIAFKYACFQVFCIPTEEMQDPDKDTPDPKAKGNKKQDKQGAVTPLQQQTQQQKPPVAEGTQKPTQTDKINEAQRKRMFAIAGKGNEGIVKEVLTKYGYEHSADVEKINYNDLCTEIEYRVGGGA